MGMEGTERNAGLDVLCTLLGIISLGLPRHLLRTRHRKPPSPDRNHFYHHYLDLQKGEKKEEEMDRYLYSYIGLHTDHG